ncbi:lustrin A [Fusarium albosuccineum]|uniref:Lustrin A n=1 Tax=Fusarium albosuccineum TaxID=1237068 RepID=A0A8H4L327_9HYPO|nr:lustrin A [Fusarium albosuccineum]
MKSVAASIGMFAAMANAYSYPRHMHFRRDNGTDSGLTTLTVTTTQVETITSCAPTITNCPARDQTALDELPETDKTTYVVTNTVVLTETVCPVSEAGSISSKVIYEAQTGGITGKTLTAPLTAAVPLSTGAYPPVTGDDSSPETSLTTITSYIVTDKTVTLTLGTGTDASTVTTTVHSTIETTLTVPCSDAPGPKVTDDGSKGSGKPDEPTTTTTLTSTGTITKTVERADSTETKTPGDDGYSTGTGENDGDDSKSTGEGDEGKSTGNGSADGECECPNADKTVTVTAPASTVYVTVGSDGSKTQGPDASVTDAPTGGDSQAEGDEDEDDDEEDEYCDTTTTLEATVTVVPYPVNNSVPTSGYAGPTGFARRLR